MMRAADVTIGETYWWGDDECGMTVVAHGRMNGEIHVTLPDASTAVADPKDLHGVTVIIKIEPARAGGWFKRILRRKGKS